MQLKEVFLVIIVVFMVLLIVATIATREIITPNESLKAAVYNNKIRISHYIICNIARVTGYEWQIIYDSAEIDDHRYCNIINIDPITELNLSYDFLTMNNSFVFYVDERMEYYSEELKENVITFSVTGWDILYPVKHSPFTGFFKSRRHILPSDCLEELK